MVLLLPFPLLVGAINYFLQSASVAGDGCCHGDVLRCHHVTQVLNSGHMTIGGHIWLGHVMTTTSADEDHEIWVRANKQTG